MATPGLVKNSVHLFSFIIRCLKSLSEHGNHLSAADDSLKQTFCKRPPTSTYKEKGSYFFFEPEESTPTLGFNSWPNKA